MLTKGLAAFSIATALLAGTADLGSVAGASEPPNSIARAEQPGTEAVPSPSDSDDEIRLAMALLIAVAAIALMGTFVYWVRTGDGPRKGRNDAPGSSPSPSQSDGAPPRKGRNDAPGSAEAGDTLK